MNKEKQVVPKSKSVTTPTELIEYAIGQNADVEKLERLFELQKRWQENEAKKSFDYAIAMFRAKCPQIKKTKQAHNSAYAGLAETIDQIKDVMAENGLSHSWVTNQTSDGMIEVTCELSHIEGYSKSTTMFGEPDTSGSKNKIQAVGSTTSYLQRYTLFAILGLASSSDDTDGNAVNLNEYMQNVRDLFRSVSAVKNGIDDGDLAIAAEAWYELTEQEKKALWVAPSKGGIFTTEERKVMQSEEFRKAFYRN